MAPEVDKDPYHLDSLLVHDEVKHTSLFNFPKEKVKYALKKYRKFMFARDPIERLWSGWVDKFYLFQGYSQDGEEILRQFRRNASRHSSRCLSDVTFEEMVNFAIWTSGENHTSHRNSHFISQEKQCQPCLVEYDYIGKTESFHTDLQYILTSTNLSSYVHLPSHNSTPSQLDLIVFKDTINFHIERSFITDYPRIRRLHCWTKTEILRRLWNSFVFRGFLPYWAMDDAGIRAFPADEAHITDMKKLVHERFVTYVQVLDSKETRRRNREWGLKSFNALPRSVAMEFMNTFSYDFELFGYNKPVLQV